MKYKHSTSYIILLFKFTLYVSVSGLQFVDNLNQEYKERSIKETFILKREYDFIVVGAGSGGSVIANRLSENPNWNVLLLEAGKDEDFFTDIPMIGWTTGLVTHNWKYKTEKQPYSCLSMDNEQCNWPRGKALGGTSVINLMVYTKGNKADFDSWKSKGNDGWGYNDVLQYFIKSERTNLVDIDAEYHGKNGSLNVEHSHFSTPLLDSFRKSAQELGYTVRDPNGKEQLGFSWVQANLRNGRRCSASKAFLAPVQHRKNLSIAKNAHVTKILIDSLTKKAYGVEFKRYFQKYHIKARKEVILSAGVMNSPQLLMLSGIGPKEHLDKHKIKVLKNLKVGYNLQDHPAFFALTFLLDEPVSVNGISLIDAYNYIINNNGPLTLPGAEGIAFMKFNNSNLNSGPPDIEVVMGAGGLNIDATSIARKIVGIPEHFYQKVFGKVKDRYGVTFVPVVLRTKSRGRIMLRNNNPYEAPLMYSNQYQDPEDIKSMIKGVRLVCYIDIFFCFFFKE